MDNYWKATWELGRDLLIAPSRALKRLEGDDGLQASLRLFAIALVAAVLFYTFKPTDFPPTDSLDLPLGVDAQQSLVFWAKVQAWEPLLTAVMIVFLGWFCWFFKSGRAGPKLILGACLGLLPTIPMLFYTRNMISKPVFGLLWLAILGGMVPGLRTRAAASWKSLTSLILAINVVNLALLLPFIATVLLRAGSAYHALEIAMVFWTLGLGAYVLSSLDGLPTSRAFSAIFLAMLCQAWFIFSIYLLGLVPKDILKAMMSV